MGLDGFDVKDFVDDGLKLLWNARVGAAEGFETCLKAVVMANGRRSTNAMIVDYEFGVPSVNKIDVIATRVGR